MGYYDSGGSVFLPADGVYLYIDKPPAKSLSKSMRSLFSGRRAQALHALLLGTRKWFKVSGACRTGPGVAGDRLAGADGA